jgi:hypothetical protein
MNYLNVFDKNVSESKKICYFAEKDSFCCSDTKTLITIALFARLISHQPAVLFCQNEPAISNQPQPASSTLLSEQISTSHQPPANRTGCM